MHRRQCGDQGVWVPASLPAWEFILPAGLAHRESCAVHLPSPPPHRLGIPRAAPVLRPPVQGGSRFDFEPLRHQYSAVKRRLRPGPAHGASAPTAAPRWTPVRAITLAGGPLSVIETGAHMKRRTFLKSAAGGSTLVAAFAPRRAGAAGASSPATNASPAKASLPAGRYTPGRIVNEYNLLLPGEREALRASPRIISFAGAKVAAKWGNEQKTLAVGEAIGGWRLVAILASLNGTPTAVFEKHVTHQGALAYVTAMGEIASIPKRVGDLAQIRPRPTSTPHNVKLERPQTYADGPDVCGDYILNSSEDPCYENVAALGAELIGWTLVANEESGPECALFLEADGTSRQLLANAQTTWAPDLVGRLFDPRRFLPSEYLYEYVPGYSKRTLVAGYLPAADIGVWNPRFRAGYEVMVVLPDGAGAHPLGRVRAVLPKDASGKVISPGDGSAGEEMHESGEVDRYWNGSAEEFFAALVGVWNRWHDFFAAGMEVEIPDEWLSDAARAGVVLSRCSYQGLEPTYQIGEGAYTKIPVRSHALFPVAHYEFVWAHQLWGLAEQAEPYFQHYLTHYILPDGNFLYNTQDQVEAPLNAGVFLELSARAYDYTRDRDALRRRLPVLRRLIDFVERRYRYAQRTFSADDPRHGLIWGSPEADNGDPQNDFPESHPYYYQNAAWIWRGLKEHARCLARAGAEHGDADWKREGSAVAQLAADVRADVERSLAGTLAGSNPAMKQAGITPITAFDTTRRPEELSSYENHRYMADWWTSDWGDPALDAGHFTHRRLAGQQILGMNIDGAYPRTSNFMEHGTLAGRIRQDDYRPFLLALYGNLCYAMDSGNRYAPEDALLPGNYPGEGSPYGWSAVVNSELQPALGLRWLLCYEEHDRDVVHLQKAAPQHWFRPAERISVKKCPTRHGELSWITRGVPPASGSARWKIEITLPAEFRADLVVHIHPPDRTPLRSASLGEVQVDRIVITVAQLAGKARLAIDVA